MLIIKNEKSVIYLFRDPSTELPAYSGLDGKCNVVHLDLARSAGVFGVY